MRYGALTGFLIILTMVGCGRPNSPVAVITSGAEFQDRLEDLEKLSKDALVKADSGESLDPVDIQNLEKSIPEFQSLIAYKPQAITLYLGQGKVFQALERHDDALMSFNAGILVGEQLSGPDVDQAVAEMHYLASRSYYFKLQYEAAEAEAKEALAKFGDNPNYLAALASVEIQLKKIGSAKQHLLKALKADHKHPLANQLFKLIVAAESSPEKK